MSMLAKVFKCCRCQGDPPEPCTHCCIQAGECGCCYGQDRVSGVQDEVRNYSGSWFWHLEYESLGDDIIEEFEVTLTQNGSSGTYAHPYCTTDVPVDMEYRYYYESSEGGRNDYECSGTATVRFEILGLSFYGCQIWTLPWFSDVSVWLRDKDLICSQGYYWDPPGAYSDFIPLGQLTPDTCDHLEQHTSLSSGNGIPVHATYDESADMHKRIFGCVDVGANCECQS